jgi:hypothetical protein
LASDFNLSRHYHDGGVVVDDNIDHHNNTFMHKMDF